MATTKQAKKPVAKRTVAKTSTRKVNATKDQTADISESMQSNFSELQNTAQKVWLAGLGAVGVSVEEIKDRYTQLNQDSRSLFKDLIVRGEKVQDEAQDVIKIRRADIEEQIETAKSRVTEFTSAIDIPASLQDVSDKLQEIGKGWRKTA